MSMVLNKKYPVRREQDLFGIMIKDQERKKDSCIEQSKLPKFKVNLSIPG